MVREGAFHSPPNDASAKGPAVPLLVIAPTARELGGLAAGRQGATTTLVTGLGEAAALSLASRLAEWRPSLVLSLGFAGALAPGLRTGALVLCDSFHSEQSESRSNRDGTRPFPRQVGVRVTTPGPSHLETDHPPLRVARERLAQAGITASPGALLTVGAPLLTRAAKQRAGEETRAAVVDMEGYWLAQEARTYQVPFIALRAVLDPMDHDLPPFVEAIVADQGRHEWRHAAGVFLTNPLRTAQLISLASQSWRAQKALRRAAEVLVPVLATQTPVPHRPS